MNALKQGSTKQSPSVSLSMFVCLLVSVSVSSVCLCLSPSLSLTLSVSLTSSPNRGSGKPSFYTLNALKQDNAKQFPSVSLSVCLSVRLSLFFFFLSP